MRELGSAIHLREDDVVGELPFLGIQPGEMTDAFGDFMIRAQPS